MCAGPPLRAGRIPSPRTPAEPESAVPAFSRSVRRACVVVALGSLAFSAPGPREARAQHRPMFDRFAGQDAAPEAWQVMPQVPVWLRPVAEPDADIVQNRGLNLVFAFRPRNRVYFSRSYGIGQMEWEPKDSSVEKVQLTTLEVSELINVSIKRVVFWNLGIGVGLMSGLIRFDDGHIRTRYEPYIPVQTGFGFYLFGPVMLDLSVWQGFFLGPGPVVSATRGLIGIGYNF